MFAGTTLDIALLKDTGFYAEIVETLYDPIIFGKGKGCTFLAGACDALLDFHEFAAIKNPAIPGCDFYLHGWGTPNSDDSGW